MMNKKHINLSVWYLIAFFILIATSAPWGNEYLVNFIFVKSYMAGIFGALLVGFVIWRTRENLSLDIQLNSIKIWLSILFLFGLLSVFWSNDADSSFSKWMIWVILFFSFYLSSQVKWDYSNFVKFSLGLLVAGNIISIIGILQSLFDFSLLFQIAPPSSTFGNRNMAAQIIVLLFPLPFFLLLSPHVKQLQIWWVAISASLMTIYLFYTTTRAAWISVIVELLFIAVYLYLNRKNFKAWIDWSKQKRNAALFSVCFVLLMINVTSEGFVPFWQSAFSNLASIVDSVERVDGETASLRYLIWNVSLEMIKDSPFFGSGLGTFYYNESNLGYATWKIRSTFHSHNDLLELGVELGAAGILLFIGVVVSIVLAVINILKKSAKKEAWFYYIIFVALVGSFINMQFSFPYQLAIAPILFGFYVAIISKADVQLKAPIKTIKQTLGTGQKSMIVGGGLLFILFVIIINLTWVNDYNNIDKLAKEVAQKRYSGFSIDAPIRYHGIQNSLHYAARFMYNKKEYEVTRLIDLQMLEYWPNDFKTMSRLVFTLIVLKRFDEAKSYISKLRDLSPKGLIFPDISGIDIDLIQGKKDLAFKKFNQLVAKSDEILSITPKNYYQLILKAIQFNAVDTIENLYQRYQNNFQVDCDTEIKLATFYKKKNQNKKALKHVNHLLKIKDSCDDISKKWLIKKGIKVKLK